MKPRPVYEYLVSNDGMRFSFVTVQEEFREDGSAIGFHYDHRDLDGAKLEILTIGHSQSPQRMCDFVLREHGRQVAVLTREWRGVVLSKDDFEKRLRSKPISNAALIKPTSEDPNWPASYVGVAIHLGENLAQLWQSGDIIVFWSNGDHTMVPERVEVLQWDLFDVK
jgi:hypothetical protein